MATYDLTTIQQGTAEIRKWTFDFTDDLPTGATVTAGTAVHTPPSGSAGTLAITVTSPYVYVTASGLTAIGVHHIEARATFSNAEVSSITAAIPVVHSTLTARSGLATLVDELRMMADAAPDEFAIAGQPFWTDKQLERELDKNRTEIYRQPLEMVDTYNSGTVEYKQYFSPYGNLEQTTGGTAIVYLENAAGTIFSTSLYTVDYTRGHVSFGSDTTGSAVYLYGRSYDLNAAAASIWRLKAGYASKMYDFSTDNHSLKRSQYKQHCVEMARYYDGLRQPESITLYREDIR